MLSLIFEKRPFNKLYALDKLLDHSSNESKILLNIFVEYDIRNNVLVCVKKFYLPKFENLNFNNEQFTSENNDLINIINSHLISKLNYLDESSADLPEKIANKNSGIFLIIK